MNLAGYASHEVVDSFTTEGEPIFKVLRLSANGSFSRLCHVSRKIETVNAFVLHVGNKLGAGIVREIGKQVVKAATVEHDTIYIILGKVGNNVQQVRLNIVVTRVEKACGIIIIGCLWQIHSVYKTFRAVVNAGPTLL